MRKTEIPYKIEVDTNILIDSAFGFENSPQLTLKDCLLHEIDYNPEYFIDALEEAINIPSYEEENYGSITRKEWEDILAVDNTSANLTDYVVNEDNYFELEISVELDIDKFEEVCNKHNIEISVEREI